MLVDAGDIVVHVMQPSVRAYYNLEELWGDGKFEKVVNSTVPVQAKPRARPPAPGIQRAEPKAAATAEPKA